jgi:hypothetical protein
VLRFQWGIWSCLLAGCVVQPTRSTPTPTTVAGLAPPPAGLVLRIGVEHLPPSERVAESPGTVRVQSLGGEEPRRTASAPEQRPRRRKSTDHTWTLSAEDLTAIDDPIARETLQFVEDLVGEDQRRVRRSLGTPFFDWVGPGSNGLELRGEEADRVMREEWVHENGPALLRRPLRLLLRRLPIASQVGVAMQDFRSDHVPLSEPYQQTHGDRHLLGRISARIRTSDLEDPLELVYMRSGVRIGSSQEVGKLSIDWPLTDTLSFQLRTRTTYENGDHELRGGLVLRPSATTSLHLTIGDNLDYLSTSQAYSLFDSPMDGAPGLLLHGVHVF